MNQAKEKKAASRTVDLLWSGGWDSTYRLLDLLLIKKFAVNTHYIIDHHRRSRSIEMVTMMKIRDKIVSTYPETKLLFNKIIFISRNSIFENKEVTIKLNNLKKIKELGPQYDMIIRYVRELEITEFELCIHVDDKAAAHVEQQVEFIQEPDGYSYWQLDRGVNKEDDLSVFSNIHFPILKLSKLDMRESAKKYGFENILNTTWWCHKPVRGKPCGVCKPCRHYIEEGMEFRFPRSAIRRNKWHFNPLIQGSKRMFSPLLRETRYFFKYIHRTLKKIFTQPSSQSNDKKKVS